MANITQLYKTPPHGEDSGMDEYKKKLFRHRAGLGIRFLVCAVVVVVIALIVFFWFRNKTYTGYEVTATSKHSSAVNTQYAEYNGRLLRYSRDGISCINAKNEADWSQTYNMQYPILDICGSAAAVADQQGNEVYVFDSQGLRAQITTLLPIQQISVSSQGVTALLLNDSDVSWIYLYDADGNMLAESRCSLDETGQPLSISLSSDGTKLAVSYLQVQEGSAGSCIVFYNFGSVGTNFVDKIVSSKVYTDTIIPRVEYLGSSVCAAVCDRGIIYYEGAEIPEETAGVGINAEILSVFFGEDRVGIITEDSQNPLRLDEDTDVADVDTEKDAGEKTEDAQEEEDAQTSEDTGADADVGDAEDAAASEDAKDTEDVKASESADDSEDDKDAKKQSSDSSKEKKAEEETGRYQVNIYDASGRLVLSRRTDLKYTNAVISRDALILYGDAECEIYSGQGVLKYAGTFDSAISAIYKTSGFSKYVVVFSDRTDTIKLK